MEKQKQLTEKDKIAYSAISDFIKENGYPPTVRELSVILGKSSTATIQQRLKSLESKGYIKTTRMGKRTVRLIKEIEEKTTVEVVHGRWEYAPDYAEYCSVCGCYPDEEANHAYNFCPNCGAKMDGDTNE